MKIGLFTEQNTGFTEHLADEKGFFSVGKGSF
jgi:hypothetical protein